MITESFVYGAFIGMALALVIGWFGGRRRRPRLPSLTGALMVAVAVAVPYAAQTIGLGLETGIVLLLAAVALVYAWKRLRPQPG